MISTSTIITLIVGVILRHFFPQLTGFLGKGGAVPVIPSPSPTPGGSSPLDELLRQLLSGQKVIVPGAATAGTSLDGTTHTVPVQLTVQTAVGRPSA